MISFSMDFLNAFDQMKDLDYYLYIMWSSFWHSDWQQALISTTACYWEGLKPLTQASDDQDHWHLLLTWINFNLSMDK